MGDVIMVLAWNLHLVVLLLLGLEFASSCTAVACVNKVWILRIDDSSSTSMLL